MIKVLADADLILELFVNRDKYSKEAERLFEILDHQSQIKIYATELCLYKINSFLGNRDFKLGQDAVSGIKKLLNNLILPFEDDIRDYARTLSINDFESAVEVAFAVQKNIGAIITLNPENFLGANLSILSANQFLERLLLEQTWNKNNSPVILIGKLQTIEFLNKLLKKNNSHTTQLIDSNLSNRYLVGFNLSNADLRGAELRGANLSAADLSDANLRGAELRGAELRGANLRGVDLSVADLSVADLSGVNLRGADLSVADLRGANLSAADLRGVELSAADLSGANLSAASLSGANLSGANLKGVDLSVTNVENARFGHNLDISESLKHDLIARGAIFENSPGDRSDILMPF